MQEFTTLIEGPRDVQPIGQIRIRTGNELFRAFIYNIDGNKLKGKIIIILILTENLPRL